MNSRCHLVEWNNLKSTRPFVERRTVVVVAWVESLSKCRQVTKNCGLILILCGNRSPFESR